MRQIVLSLLTGVLLVIHCGCSVRPVGLVMVNHKNFEADSGLPVMQLQATAQLRRIVRIDEQIEPPNPNRGQGRTTYRVSYDRSHKVNGWAVVQGRLANGNSYPVVLDTGASPPLFVNDIHIVENNLPVRPFRTSPRDPVGRGMCQLPELRIGPIVIAEWPCFYREQHFERRFLGLAGSKDKTIIAGLGVLRAFKYVAFDGINKEAEFSLDRVFEPADANAWASYPLQVEEGWQDNAYLFVIVPVAGREIRVQLDTGSGRGLAISRRCWQELSKRIPNTKLHRGKDLYPYIGWVNCRRGVIRELEVGNRTIENAMVSVFPDDSPLAEQCNGLLGMQYFEDAIMVLDFERNLMWIKDRVG